MPNFQNIFMVINWITVYDILGFCRHTNTFYAAKRSFRTTLAHPLLHGSEHLNSVFHN